MAFCKNCGSNINDEDKYCNSCGYNQFKNETKKNIVNHKKIVKEIIYIILIILVFIAVIYGNRYITNKNIVKTKDQATTNKDKGKNVDLEIVDSNQMGNTASNIKNGGIAVSQGDTIYYSNLSDNGCIYKMDKSGTSSKLIQDKRCFYLNIIGSWIYYLNTSHDNYKIYMSKIDGTQSNSLDVIVDSKPYLDNHLTLLISKGNWLYYATNYAIYRIKSDGSENKKIIDLTQSNESWTTRINYLNIIDDTIYYNDNNFSEKNIIYAVDINDGTRKVVFNSPTELYKIDIVNGWIYYISNNWLVKVRIGDSNIIPILKVDYIFYNELNVDGDWIYYASGKNKRTLHRVKIDGSKNIQLSSDQYINGINIVGDWYICPIGDTAKLSIGRLPN